MNKTMTFALVGNPNCGKTTLFNALTGSTAHVGNWPGVTVDKREGVYKGTGNNVNVSVVDLPGIYSLSPYTPEEVVARNYILDEHPHGIINIVDATNLERNLYLTTQLLEMDVPVIVALNMMDEVEGTGDSIDVSALEEALGVPVVAVSALKGTGVDQLMKRAMALKERKGYSFTAEVLGDKLTALQAFYEERGVSSPLFHAVKLLDEDELELAKKGARQKRKEVMAGSQEDMMAVIADARYAYISKHFSTKKKRKRKELITASDKADRVLTHRIFGLPLFIVVLFAIFHLTFSENFLFLGGIFQANEIPSCFLGTPYEGLLWTDAGINSPGVMLFNCFDMTFSLIIEQIAELLENANAQVWVSGLLCDGVLSGIFAVLGFLPQILVLFLLFSIMEDTGYMARVAFILDRFFRNFGLSGRAVLPMIMGFGCSVPAMINTRTLADEKERTATVRVIPFFSCGAKLPILIAMGGTFCGMVGMDNVDLVTFSMYAIGIVSAIVCVLIMRNTTQRGETPPFIMELPSYRAPGFKNLMLHLWDKAKHFIEKAFTVIFASTVVIWLFSHLTWQWQYVGDEQMHRSILASLGMFIQPLFTPLGFGAQLTQYGWVFAVAAITGLIAKENVIATFSTLAACITALIGGEVDIGVIGGLTEELIELEGVGEAAAMAVATGITPAAILAFIAFNMTTIPCFAAVATARGELAKGKFKWTLLFWLASSYVIGTIVYTVGSAPWTLALWLAVAAVIALFIVLYNKGILRRNQKIKNKSY